MGSATPRISVIADPTKRRYPSIGHVPPAVRTVGVRPTEASIMRPLLDAHEEEPRSRSSGQHRLPDPGLDILDLAGENVNDGIHERQLIA